MEIWKGMVSGGDVGIDVLSGFYLVVVKCSSAW